MDLSSSVMLPEKTIVVKSPSTINTTKTKKPRGLLTDFIKSILLFSSIAIYSKSFYLLLILSVTFLTRNLKVIKFSDLSLFEFGHTYT